MSNNLLSNLESDIDKWNICDSELDSDVENILQDLIIEENIENDNEKETKMEYSKWSEFRGRQKIFPFTGTSGINVKLPNTINPYEVFSLFVNEEVINLIVKETNRYAERSVHHWKPTNPNEIKKFMGLIIWLDFIKTRPAVSYWSQKLLFNLDIPHLIMEQNRFELLLSNIHFANTTIVPDNLLDQIVPLCEILQANYQKILTPGENIIINETLIPWHGRPIFNQYIPKKTHEYGIKLFKLCTPEGFTWSIMMCSSKYYDIRETKFAYNVCVALAKNLFNQGRTLYINNFYTNYKFAISCLKQKTHVVGLVRNNTRSIPKDILQSKLQKGKMISKEDDNGIVILKWRDSRDVRILSTKHVPIMVPYVKYWNITNKTSNNSKSNVKLKPIAFIEYNKMKCIINHSEQLISCITTIMKGMKWYQKLGMQFLLGVTVVNAFVIYNQATNKNIQIEQFKEILAEQLLEIIFSKL